MKPGRFEALDALRGLAVLGMCWSGLLPDELPRWMFHAQVPPPDHKFNPNLPGITWVDLVFPFFLFALGAAIPLAIAGRIERGAKFGEVTLGLLQRGFLLAAYALLGEHLRPYTRSPHPDSATWIQALLGFGALCLMLGRWPKAVDRRLGWLLTGVGWAGALWLAFSHTYPDGRAGFANYRNDVILLIMANVSVSGGLIWYFTRERPWARLVAFTAVMAVFLTASMPGGLGKWIWDFTPVDWLHLDANPKGVWFPILYHFEYHKYLLIVLPGTICGDLLRGASTAGDAPRNWGKVHGAGLALHGVVLCAIACWGLFVREVVLVSLVLLTQSAVMVWLTRLPGSPREAFVAKSLRWALGILLIGLILEPFGGGIKKDSATISYFFVTSGLAFAMIASLVAFFDLLGLGRGLQWVSQTGANPILGYVATTNLVGAVSALTGYGLFIVERTNNPWMIAFAQGGVLTLAVAAVTSFATRRGWFLRA